MQRTANNFNTQTDTVNISPLSNFNTIQNLLMQLYNSSSFAQIYKHLFVVRKENEIALHWAEMRYSQMDV